MEHREERTFGLTVGTVCGLLAVYGLWRGHPATAAVLGTTAVLLLAAAFMAPAWLRQLNAGWMRLAHALGWVNSRILLSLFFALVLMPVGLLLRAGGWDPLGRRRRAAPTGWVPYPERRRDRKHYERMY